VKIAHLRAAGAVVSASFDWRGRSVDATLTNEGQPIHLELAPDIPLGASHLLADVNGKPIAAAIKSWDEEQQAEIELELPHGITHCRFEYAGGVWVEVPRAQPRPGASSRQLHLRNVSLHGTELAIQADILDGANSSLIVETPWHIAAVEGGSAIALSPTRAEIHFTLAHPGPMQQYIPATLRIRFQ
jgi:hypothetical protein